MRTKLEKEHLGVEELSNASVSKTLSAGQLAVVEHAIAFYVWFAHNASNDLT
jgi:hypothetical protein